MVEVVTAALEDQLIDPLSFRLTKTASYITKRRSCTFHPQGSNIYHPTTGTKLIKILLSGSDWLDPGTFRIMFDLKNDDGAGNHNLYPVSGAWGFFSRMRILSSGQVLEDIDNYNSVHEMIECMSTTDNNDYGEGFGNYWRSESTPRTVSTVNRSLTRIPPSSSMTVIFKPIAGLFQSVRKFLPLQFMPITIELSLVDNPLDPIIYTNVADPGDGTRIANSFYTNVTSNLWSILNVQAKCDLVTLDNSFEESFYKSISEGKPLNINYNTLISQMQTITGQVNLNVNVSRSLTRLKSVFVSLSKTLPEVAVGTFARTRGTQPGSKDWNTFYSPMFNEFDADAKINSTNGEFEMQLQIGSSLYPEYRIRSHAEAYYNLKKTLGIRSNVVHNFNIDGIEYRRDKFIIGIDTERVLEAGFSGLSTRAGDLMTVMFKYNSEGVDQRRLADRMHIILHSDQIIEVHSHGVRVLD
jgi:hypothetical protein